MYKLILSNKKNKKKGIALVIFMIVMLILFLLFGALTYRVQTSMLISRNNYIETQAEATAQAAARHAISVISLIGFDNFPNTIINPPFNLNTANEPTSVPATTYDLARDPAGNPPPNSPINNTTLANLSSVQLTRDFSYRVCTWQYDPNNNRYSMRIKIFVF
ncbi:MAG: hypothetical protein ACK4ZM_00040 [bacterium]